VDPVRRQEAVVDPLPQAVLIDGIAEVEVGIPVVFPERCGGHPQLKRRGEILQDLPPVAAVAGASPVAFIDDDQFEEVRPVLL